MVREYGVGPVKVELGQPVCPSSAPRCCPRRIDWDGPSRFEPARWMVTSLGGRRRTIFISRPSWFIKVRTH